MGDLPAQPRRADAGNGHRRRARLSVETPMRRDKRARINLGIRRRLAPLMERDRARIELMNALLLTMPGTPVLYYGDEIGMGDNIFLGDRDGVRTPMQWSPDRNGGFSRADPASADAARHPGPALRLRGGQCRGAGARPAFAAQLGQAHACRAPRPSGLRPRHADFPAPAQPQDPRLTCANMRANPFFVSPILAVLHRRSNSTCMNSRAVRQWNSPAAPPSRRSASCRIC